jgi:hypothetical protein
MLTQRQAYLMPRLCSRLFVTRLRRIRAIVHARITQHEMAAHVEDAVLIQSLVDTRRFVIQMMFLLR